MELELHKQYCQTRCVSGAAHRCQRGCTLMCWGAPDPYRVGQYCLWSSRSPTDVTKDLRIGFFLWISTLYHRHLYKYVLVSVWHMSYRFPRRSTMKSMQVLLGGSWTFPCIFQYGFMKNSTHVWPGQLPVYFPYMSRMIQHEFHTHIAWGAPGEFLTCQEWFSMKSTSPCLGGLLACCQYDSIRIC